MRQIRGLIVHADDFGETEEITRGISSALEAGAINSTSIMANMPGTRFALGETARFGDTVSFGLHLNLCEGTPLTPCPSLTTAGGTFRTKRDLALRAIGGLLSAREVDREVQAQAALLIDAGVRLSHIDGHKHLHQLPIVRDAVVRAAHRFGLQRVRRSVSAPANRYRGPATVVRDALGRRAGALFSANRLRYPDQLVDIVEIERAPTASAGAALLGAEPIVEVFCHPGTERADIEKPGSCVRNAELRFLLSDRWTEVRRTSAREPMTYWQV